MEISVAPTYKFHSSLFFLPSFFFFLTLLLTAFTGLPDQVRPQAQVLFAPFDT